MPFPGSYDATHDFAFIEGRIAKTPRPWIFDRVTITSAICFRMPNAAKPAAAPSDTNSYAASITSDYLAALVFLTS
jgi:hypothetical protein